MGVWSYGLGFTLALGFGMGLGGGCSATGGGRATTAGTGGSGAGTTGTAGGTGLGGMTTGTGGSTGTGLGDASLPDGLDSCTTFTATAKQAPAAMLIVLQRSASMATPNTKWPAAQKAIIQAIDEDVFDTMSLGFSAFPSGYVGAPDCLCPGMGPHCCIGAFCALPNGVSCGFPMNPQVAVTPAGNLKSSASSGVRHDIAQWLMDAIHGPDMGDPANGTPMYDTLVGAYGAVTAVPNVAKRMVILVSDGGGSCTSLSNRTASAISDGMCPDWESPLTMRTLISGAQTAATNPVETLIIGVPGSNSNGGSPFGYATAPYSMLLALSTYAVAGSPTTVDPTCDMGAVWTQSGSDPAHPCHIDLSNGNNFNAAALAKAIATLRGKALGCVYDLPPPPVGQTIDPNKVNVIVTINGVPTTIPKRSNPTDMCPTEPGCWDYDSMGKVNLIGVTCNDVSTSASAKVDIDVGCDTIIK